MDNKILVSNIQRFCLHDGPGIRTTVFLKGCNLSCPWCSNPENIFPEIENYILKEGREETAGTYGRYLSLREIYAEVLKDKTYYRNGGGVTFSGGEPLFRVSKYEPLLMQLRDDNISLCVETALFISERELKLALKYIDTMIIDIKILEKEQCRNILGGDLDIYLANIEVVNNSMVNVIYRVPLVPPYTTNDKNIEKIIDFLQDKHFLSLELIKGHNLAKKKYESLNKINYNIPEISGEEMKCILHKFEKSGITAQICKI